MHTSLSTGNTTLSQRSQSRAHSVHIIISSIKKVTCLSRRIRNVSQAHVSTVSSVSHNIREHLHIFSKYHRIITHLTKNVKTSNSHTNSLRKSNTCSCSQISNAWQKRNSIHAVYTSSRQSSHSVSRIFSIKLSNSRNITRRLTNFSKLLLKICSTSVNITKRRSCRMKS